MVSQAGAQGGRRLTDAKPPVNEEQGDGVSPTAIAISDENRDQQHNQDATRVCLGSLPPKAMRPNPVTLTARAGCTRASENGASRSISHEPPVTKATLSELDIPRIIFNPKLRHDVNFDPDLHFRPNLDGEKGRRKAQKQSDFWQCFRAQLESFMTDQSAFMTELGEQTWCLPLTLHAIGEILATLVPPEDRSVVEEILNVDLLMQQFSKGVADLEKLALWLSRTLKSHCAPMRDEWVDEMVKHLSNGNLNRDISLLVQGLQTLLAILESMKLDVANHQIRCLRPLLIQDTVEFEQTYFMKKIATRKVNVAAAFNFFNASKLIPDDPRTSQGDMWVFFKGFVNLLRPSNVASKRPDTFMFDEERIIKLRSAILNAVNLDVCIRLYRNECQREHSPSRTPNSTTYSTPSTPALSWNSGTCSSRSISPISKSEFPSPSLVSIPDFKDALASDSLKKPTQRSKSQLSDDATSSKYCEIREHEPPSLLHNMSGSLPNISTPPSIPQPWETVVEQSESSIRQSILALIDESAGDSRWQQSCPAIALQILRSTRGLNTFTAFESRLGFYLGNVTSDLFQTSEASVLGELYSTLDDFVVKYAQLSSTQLFEITSVPQRLPSRSPACSTALSVVAKQVAHIGILHWRVWAPLVYLVNPDTDDSTARAGHNTSDGVHETTPNPAQQPHTAARNGHRRSPERQNSFSEIHTRS